MTSNETQDQLPPVRASFACNGSVEVTENEVVQRPAVSWIVWLGVAELKEEYGVTREHGVKAASARGADRLVLCPMNLLLVEDRGRIHWLAVCARHRFGYRAAFAVSRDDHFPVA